MSQALRKTAIVPYTFVLMNWAAVVGLYYFLRGCEDVWNSSVSEEAAR